MSYAKFFKENQHLSFGSILIEIKEPYLFEHWIESLKQLLIQDFLSFNFFRYDPKKSRPSDLSDALSTYPFMDEKKIILIDSLNNGMEDGVLADMLYAYFENPSQHIALILADGEEIKHKKKITSFIGTKNAFKIEKLDKTEYKNWIKTIGKKNQISFDATQVEKIMERSHYLDKYDTVSLYEVENQIIKLAAYRQNLSAEVIETYFDEPIENNIFKMVDAIVAHQRKQAFEYLDILTKKNTPKRQVYAMLLKQYRNLYHVRFMQAHHFSVADMEGYLKEIEGKKLHPYVFKKLLQSAEKMELLKLEEMQKKLLDLEYRSKTGRLDGDMALELLLI